MSKKYIVVSPKVYNLKLREIVSGVYIGRGSKWGNPFIIGRDGNREEVIEKYVQYAEERFTEEDFKELKGKNLLCFCKPLPCHGDYLLKKANGG